jgi:hypothetical protein
MARETEMPTPFRPAQFFRKATRNVIEAHVFAAVFTSLLVFSLLALIEAYHIINGALHSKWTF